MVALSCREGLVWSLTPGQAGGCPEGRQLIEAIGVQDAPVYLLMDSAYGGNELRASALQRNLQPVVPSHPQRKLPWPLDKQRYRQRNEVERLCSLIGASSRAMTSSMWCMSPSSLWR